VRFSDVGLPDPNGQGTEQTKAKRRVGCPKYCDASEGRKAGLDGHVGSTLAGEKELLDLSCGSGCPRKKVAKSQGGRDDTVEHVIQKCRHESDSRNRKNVSVPRKGGQSRGQLTRERPRGRRTVFQSAREARTTFNPISMRGEEEQFKGRKSPNPIDFGKKEMGHYRSI